MFRTCFDKKRVVSNVGSGIETDFQLTVDEDGQEIFEVIGETDLYSQIQSHRASTELSSLLARYQNGALDPFSFQSILFQNCNGQYMDTVGMPKTYAEMFRRAREAEQAFSRLPLDVRKEFDNSHMVFWSKVGTPEFNSVYEKYMHVGDETLAGGGVDSNESKSE